MEKFSDETHTAIFIEAFITAFASILLFLLNDEKLTIIAMFLGIEIIFITWSIPQKVKKSINCVLISQRSINDLLKNQIREHKVLQIIANIYDKPNKDDVSSAIANRALSKIEGIGLGIIEIKKACDYFEAFLDVVTNAKETVHAIDQIDFKVWKIYLKDIEYLACQKNAITNNKISISRIRIVEQEKIKDTDYMSDLKSYKKDQEDAGVTLLFCYWEDVKHLIHVRKGWVMADKNNPNIICCAVGLLEKGKVEEGYFFLKNMEEVQSLSKIFDEVYALVENNGWNAIIRQEIDKNV